MGLAFFRARRRVTTEAEAPAAVEEIVEETVEVEEAPVEAETLAAVEDAVPELPEWHLDMLPEVYIQRHPRGKYVPLAKRYLEVRAIRKARP
jgi:hypothetical protein